MEKTSLLYVLQILVSLTSSVFHVRILSRIRLDSDFRALHNRLENYQLLVTQSIFSPNTASGIDLEWRKFFFDVNCSHWGKDTRQSDQMSGTALYV